MITEITLNISFRSLSELKYSQNKTNKIDAKETVMYIFSNNLSLASSISPSTRLDLKNIAKTFFEVVFLKEGI